MRRFFAFAVLVLWLSVLPMAAVAQSAFTRVTFLLVNDIYSMSEQAQADGRARGGVARLAAVVKSERGKGGHVVFAHAGDTLSPSLMSGLDRGAHMVALTNMIPPDIFVPGNHEFDFGRAVFLERMRAMKAPLYAANIRSAGGEPLAGFRDRAIVTFEGVRIGLTGAAYDQTPRASNPQDLRFGPTAETIAEQAKLLRQEGADFVLGVIHGDRALASGIHRARDADLLLTGHSHDLFIAYDGRNAMAESSFDAHYVVAIDVAIAVTEKDGQRQTHWWPRFRVIDTADVIPDAEVAAAVRVYEAELSREMDVALAKTLVTLDSRTALVRSREAALGNLIADAMRASTGAEVAVMNGGGIRASRVYPAGSEVSRRDVLKEVPFGNRVSVLEMSGADLQSAIETGLSRLPNPSGGFPHVSGMTVEASLEQPPGNRVLSIKVGGGPIEPDRIYTVATNDFLARGGDGYTTFQQARRLTPDYDAKLLANEVMAHLRRLGTVQSVVEGRVVLR